MTAEGPRTPAQLFDLSGKVALVTGGSRGLGRAIALGYAAAGADVIVASRKLDACEAVATEITAMGRKALAVPCHVGRWSDIEALVQRCYEHFGRIDILVNNAGLSPTAASSAETSEELFDKIVAVNFKGPFRLSALVAERMAAADGGSVISISSTGALRPAPDFGPYAGSKAALNAISVAFAREFAPTVRFNVISPGGFFTDISKGWAKPGEDVPGARCADTAIRKKSSRPRCITPATRRPTPPARCCVWTVSIRSEAIARARIIGYRLTEWAVRAGRGAVFDRARGVRAMSERGVEVYLLILGDHLPDPRTGRVATEAERLTGMVRQAVVAEAAGFTGVAVGEHHFSRYLVSAPELVLSSIAAATSHLRLASGVTLLPHRDPVRVAEELAILDALSGGRAELTVARGVSRDTDRAFGIAESELSAAFEEKLRLLLQLLTSEDVSWRGRFRAPLEHVTTRPRPIQQPHPPVRVGSGSLASTRFAAELGLPLMLPSSLRDPLGYLSLVTAYREKAGPRGKVGLPSHVFVGDTTAAARERWLPYLSSYADFACVLRGASATAPDVDELLHGSATCGDPDHVAEQLNSLAKQLDLDTHLILADIGGLPISEVLETVQTFGAEVIPRLRGGRPDAAARNAPAAGSGRPFSSIETALADLRAGRMIVVRDSADRENEGDLVIAADYATDAAITFMAVHGRGLICLALTPQRCEQLRLSPLPGTHDIPHRTAFTASIEARTGVTTGISAADRARTIRLASDSRYGPEELIQPGHVFPLRARPGGVLTRQGHTEAAVDLARLAGLTPAGVICEIMNDDGTMARVPDLAVYCRRHMLTMITISDLVEYRRACDAGDRVSTP